MTLTAWCTPIQPQSFCLYAVVHFMPLSLYFKPIVHSAELCSHIHFAFMLKRLCTFYAFSSIGCIVHSYTAIVTFSYAFQPFMAFSLLCMISIYALYLICLQSLCLYALVHFIPLSFGPHQLALVCISLLDCSLCLLWLVLASQWHALACFSLLRPSFSLLRPSFGLLWPCFLAAFVWLWLLLPCLGQLRLLALALLSAAFACFGFALGLIWLSPFSLSLPCFVKY